MENSCLGNCEIAELLMRSAEKVGVRLDQVVNREGKKNGSMSE